MSRYVSDLKLLSREEQEMVLVMHDIWDELDDISVDSVMTPRTVKIYEILKVGSIRWRDLPIEIIIAWKERAAALNRLPINGKLKRIPLVYKLPSLNNNVVESVQHDWCYVGSLFRSAIMRKPKGGESERMYKFGDEEVVLGNQSYRALHLNFLVRLSLFGDNFDGLKYWEIVKRTKHVVVVHIASYARMCQIFGIADLSAVKFTKGSLLYTCAGKVSLFSKSRNRIMVGYVICETKMKFTVHCSCEDDITLRKPRFKDGVYIFDDCTDYEKDVYIAQYWPIRFKVSVSGATSFTMNRLVLDNEFNIVCNL